MIKATNVKSPRRRIFGCLLTVKLRGRAEAPANGAEGAQSLSARGADPEALHGPLQRLLEVAPIEATVRAHFSRRKPKPPDAV